ncbi:hypothetical protein [Paracraurococcus lichenis]|uniref:DUF2383 domain-containing protein n=1 Tax=Paracraurococcus lichenis TaxID=3064888 RepID=A0ABT9EBQ3_9PROT|nr:hypothetical protein [Paracraurococcus sp. LOR1-02]MDO9713642.1 hypothetical protein [Paracraurococcus sp. LOR1-02]
MSSTPDRRTLFGLVSIAVTESTAGHACFLSAAGAEPLLQLGKQWQELMQEHDQISCLLDEATDEVEGEALGALQQQVWEMMKQVENAITAEPAQTIAGLQVKARVVERYGEWARVGDVERSLLADLLREMKM